MKKLRILMGLSLIDGERRSGVTWRNRVLLHCCRIEPSPYRLLAANKKIRISLERNGHGAPNVRVHTILFLWLYEQGGGEGSGALPAAELVLSLPDNGNKGIWVWACHGWVWMEWAHAEPM